MSENPLAAFNPGTFLFKVSYEITVGSTGHRYILAENFKDVERLFQSYFDVTLETLICIERLSDLVYFPAEWEILNKVSVVAILT